MFNHQLERILRGSPITHPFFLGVFAPRELHKIRSPPLRYCFILGTTNSSRRSGHWVAVFVDGVNAYVFCSLGTHPYRLPKLKDFLKNYKSIFFNRRAHQDPTSTVCGGYCCYVLYHMCLGIPFVKILRKFDIVKYDDRYIRRFMLRQYGISFE